MNHPSESPSLGTCRKPARLLGNLAMVAAVLLWGSSFVSIKITVSVVPPITMALLRFMIASSALYLLHRRMEPHVQLDPHDRFRMAAAGFLGVTVYFVLENSGVKLSTASNAALITSVIPILATGLDIGVNKTRLTPALAAGLLLSLAGSYLAVTAHGRSGLDPAHIRGNLLIVGAMAAWSFYTLYNKKLGSRYSGLMTTAYQQISGTVFLLPLALTEYREWGPVPPVIWLHIGLLAVFCSAGCYLLYIYALRKLDVAVTTMYLNLVPLVGVLGGYVWLGETVSPIQLAGGGLILAGILAVTVSGRPAR